MGEADCVAVVVTLTGTVLYDTETYSADDRALRCAYFGMDTVPARALTPRDGIGPPMKSYARANSSCCPLYVRAMGETSMSARSLGLRQ